MKVFLLTLPSPQIWRRIVWHQQISITVHFLQTLIFLVHFVESWSCNFIFVCGLLPYIFAVCVCLHVAVLGTQEVHNQESFYIFVMGTQRCQFDASPSTISPIYLIACFRTTTELQRTTIKLLENHFPPLCRYACVGLQSIRNSRQKQRSRP